MITLKEWMELAEYKITEGSDFHANISPLYSLTSWNEREDGYSFHIVFAPADSQRAYAVEACDYKNNRAYRLRDPELELDDTAWDDVKWIELEVDDDFIQKCLAIREGENYDTRVSIPVDFSDEELLKYMTLAHERDMTFNQFMEEALRSFLANSALDKKAQNARDLGLDYE